MRLIKLQFIIFIMLNSITKKKKENYFYHIVRGKASGYYYSRKFRNFQIYL